ncbi:MAG: methionyl-tRNA formyltransferase [Chlamydiales bacterium]
MRVIFFGTPSFAATILSYLTKQPIEIIAVVSRPDQPQGRGQHLSPTPVKKIAEQYGIPIYQPHKASSEDFIDLLKTHNPDLFVVAAYAEILKQDILEIPKLGCLNVHASLLPKYRGAAPVQRALMAGEKDTGVSIIKMSLEMDAGDIYSIVKIPILEEMNAGDLLNQIADVGSEALGDVISKIEKQKIRPVPQDHSAATFAKKIQSGEREINWRSSAETIHNQIRGLTPNPGAWCEIQLGDHIKRLGVIKTRKILDIKGRPATLSSETSKIIVYCGEGALELLEVQLAGKTPLPANIFLNGIQDFKLKFLLK